MDIIEKLKMLEVPADVISEVESLGSQAIDRKAKLTEIATAAGANAAVLEKLLGDRADKLTIDRGEVLLDGKPLKQAVDEDETLQHFKAALFPTKPNPIAAYIKRTYTGIKGIAK